jgi:hypothetical protein
MLLIRIVIVPCKRKVSDSLGTLFGITFCCRFIIEFSCLYHTKLENQEGSKQPAINSFPYQTHVVLESVYKFHNKPNKCF